ncbi:MAG: hypothetical protein LBO63_06735, partial [Oscillospiraceae bacterium]|nr:hypothetical protein [Oscillospiraceae bacterium]
SNYLERSAITAITVFGCFFDLFCASLCGAVRIPLFFLLDLFAFGEFGAVSARARPFWKIKD